VTRTIAEWESRAKKNRMTGACFKKKDAFDREDSRVDLTIP